jgi:parvulin-like peptidyl-prolyl isomerase
MTSILNRVRGTTRTARHASDPEERFQRRVTIGFITLIVVVVAIVVIALLYNYWEQHFKPVASVNGAGITRDQWTDRARIEDLRLERRTRELRAALAAGEITQQEFQERHAAVEQERSGVASSSIENLIDLTYQGQLASQEGVTVTDADVEASVAADSGPPEQRRLDVIFVDPASEVPGGDPGPDELQAAYKAAHDAADALAAGTPFADVAREYSTDESKDDGGAYGLVSRTSQLDTTFLEAVFAQPQGGTTPVIEGEDGIYRIGRVSEIVQGQSDPGFRAEVEQRVPWGTYLANVRMETVADALEDKVRTDATAATEQVRLAEIFLAGDTELTPEEDSGHVKASHILYSPNDDPQTAGDLPEDDPEWAEAEEQARAAAAELQAIADVDERMAAFAEKAKTDSDDTGSGANGGDLGFFDKGTMVPEFSDAVFGKDLQRGDVLDPVKSQFGWHVIEYVDQIPPLHERLAAVQSELDADDADFGAIAAASSDGAEAIANGELGWRTRNQLESEAAEVVFALEPVTVAEPVAQDDGWHIYHVEEKAPTRPLDPEQSAEVLATAFDDWYDPKKEAAEDAGQITRDDAVFATDVSGLE